jgi:tRNA G18 (ribose-2'-O)-methylase SpoU
MPIISSPQNSKIRLVRALMGRRKEREENRAFVVEGVRLLEEAFSAGWQPQFVLFSEGAVGARAGDGRCVCRARCGSRPSVPPHI